MRDLGPKFSPPGWVSSRMQFDYTHGDGRKLYDSRLADPYILNSIPRVIFTVEEIEELSFLDVELRSFTLENRARWITQGGVDDDWDNYLATLQNLGVERFVQIHRDALERFLAN